MKSFISIPLYNTELKKIIKYTYISIKLQSFLHFLFRYKLKDFLYLCIPSIHILPYRVNVA